MFDVALLKRFDRPVPRYTSYPTAPEWSAFTEAQYIDQLKALGSALSLYIHIPFCKSMCLFCGCSVILNRRAENEERYVQYLFKEIELLCSYLTHPKVKQIHFGGGTPTKLSVDQLGRIMEKLQSHLFFEETELSIEIDPRTVYEDRGEKLRCIRELGFQRVSFGIQDLDPKVQEAVRRRQSEEMSLTTFQLARELGFEGINVDLIYGLPYQGVDRFSHTIEKIIQMGPDRIALFSYAKVPWLKEHQKAICEKSLPSTEEKFQIYLQAREKLIAGGYVALGMDHFAKKSDAISLAYQNATLHRNFQGYTVNLAEDMLGLGVTSIGYCKEAYVQNVKDLQSYYQALDQGSLPVYRGHILSKEDRVRRWVINRLMCQFEIDKRLFQNLYGVDFSHYFAKERASIETAIEEGLLLDGEKRLRATSTGRLFIRNVAAIFDQYLKRGVGHFSKGV